MTELQKLYLKIPNSTCIADCGKCCADFIQMAPEEIERLGGYDYVDGCPYKVDGRCTVYENRPLICRIFGSSEIMKCEGCTPDRYLTADETRDIMSKFVRICEDEKTGKK